MNEIDKLIVRLGATIAMLDQQLTEARQQLAKIEAEQKSAKTQK